MKIAAMVLGIAALLLFYVPVLGVILSITALIISIIAMSKNKKEKKGKGFAIAGLTTSIIGLILAIIVTAIFGTAFYFFKDNIRNYNEIDMYEEEFINIIETKYNF